MKREWVYQTDRLVADESIKRLECCMCHKKKKKEEFTIIQPKQGCGGAFYNYACKSCQEDVTKSQDELPIRDAAKRVLSEGCCRKCAYQRPLTKKCLLNKRPRFGACRFKDEKKYYAATSESY